MILQDIKWIYPIVTSILSLLCGGIIVVMSYKGKIQRAEERNRDRISLIHNTITDQNGRLNVIDSETCKEYRKEMSKLHDENKEDHKTLIENVARIEISIALILQKLEIVSHPD